MFCMIKCLVFEHVVRPMAAAAAAVTANKMHYTPFLLEN